MKADVNGIQIPADSPKATGHEQYDEHEQSLAQRRARIPYPRSVKHHQDSFEDGLRMLVMHKEQAFPCSAR